MTVTGKYLLIALGVVVIVDPVVRDIPCHADDSSALEPLQIVECRVVAHHCDTLVAPLTARNGVEHAGVVEAIAGVGPDQQHVARAVRVHQLSDLRGRAELLAGRRVVSLRLVGEARGIEDVHVAVDLRLLGDGHWSTFALRASVFALTS